MQVPIQQFPGYVARVVKELHAPLVVAVNGTLTGEGTLGTVLLCEALLGYLPLGMDSKQPRPISTSFPFLT